MVKTFSHLTSYASLILFVLLTATVLPAWAELLDNWTWRNPLPQGNTIRSITYGGSTFVAVGNGGTILTSPDGVNWTPQTSGTTNDFNGVAYGGSTFVAAGNSGAILTSPDGVTWTSRTSGVTNGLSGVTYGGSTFVAVGSVGKILTSPDGVTWTSRTSGTTNNLLGVTYGGATFVAVGSGGKILTSSDGMTWTTRTSGTSDALVSVTYGGSTFVAVGYAGKILTSADGVTWTSQTSGTSDTLYGVTYGGSTFIAVGMVGTIVTSPDGVTWTTRTSGTTNDIRGVTYGGSTFVAVGNYGTILTSPDGVTWATRTSGITNWLYDVTYGGSTFVAVGNGILTSPDGVTWTSRTSGTTNMLLGVTYGGSTFVAVGGFGTIVTSPDGVTWTTRTSGTTNDIRGVTYGGSTFVAVGYGGTIVTSPDGVTWTTQTSVTLYDVTYGGSTFVAVSDSGYIHTSPDGVTWTPQVSATLWSVTYGGSTFVAVGSVGNILTSADGVTWTTQTSGVTNGLMSVTYGGSTFVAVGGFGTIVTSPDGVTWTTRTSGTTNDIRGVTYGSSTFVAVGVGGTILQAGAVTDTTAPTGSISINSGAASTNAASVTLTLSCTDVGGCAEMQFSNDNTTWLTAETYGTSKSWTLASGDGTKTVYVKFKDTAGNWSGAYSDTIVRDTAAPTTAASPGGNVYATAQTVTLTCSDGTGAGCDKIYYTTDGTTPTTSSTVYLTPISISATTTLKFFAKDMVGNSGSMITLIYTIGSSLPAGSIITIAGNGTAAYSGDGGAATSAMLNYPQGVSVDASGNIYIADYINYRIRKVDTAGVITTVAGNGSGGTSGDGGPAISASFYAPNDVFVDSTGNIYIAEGSGNRIRKVNTSGIITTVAGVGSGGYYGNGGPATSAELNNPMGVSVDSVGNIYIADYNNHRIRKVDTAGVITTVAGNGTAGYSGDGSQAISAMLNYPQGVFADSSGNIYIADVNNQRVRKVDTSGVITTVAGNGTFSYSGDGGASTLAGLMNPSRVFVDSSGNIYIADAGGQRIRKVDTAGVITTVAGNGTAGYSGDGGPATSAMFYNPKGIFVDSSGNIYIADSDNKRIRKVIGAGTSDTTSPTGTISINSGAASTNSTTATLTLSCSDASGCSQMQFSNDNSTWSTAETYATSKTWTLTTGDGTKTVYVKFKDTAGNWSSSYSDTIAIDTSVSSPTNISVDNPGVKGQLIVTWTNPADVDFNHIHIYRSTASGSLGTLIADNVTGIKYTDTGLASLTTYYYTVKSVDNAGNESTNTTKVSAKTSDATPPAVPTGVTAVDATTGGKINLSWTNPTDSDFSMIKIYRSTESGTLGSAVFIGVATSYSNTGLTNGVAYYYTVRAIDTSSNETTNTTQVSATPTAPDATPPTVPTTGGTPVLNTQAGGTLTISWTNPADSDFAFVRIYRSTTSGVLGNLVYDNVTGTSVTDTGLTNNATYYYTIRSVDTAGNESTNTNQVSGMPTDIQVPKNVTGLTTTLLSDGKIRLDWTRSSSTDVNAYNIYYDNGTGTIDYTYANKIGTVQHPTTTWTSGNFAVGPAYKFAVRAEDSAQNEETNTSVVASAVPVTNPNAGDVRGYIKVPQTGQKISGNRVTVVTDLLTGASIDVKDMRFQYKPASSGSWTDITPADPAFPNPDTTHPWFTHWDVTSLATGDYLIRAIATNVNLSTDATPAYITVTVDNSAPEASEGTNAQNEPEKRQNVSANAANKTAIATESGVTELAIPEGALSTDTRVTVTVEAPATKDSLVPSGYGKANEFRDITLDSGQTSLSNNKEAEIVIPYKDDNNDNIIDGTVTKVYDTKVMRYNETTLKWEKLDSIVDTTNKVVKGKTNHFTLFGLLAPPNPTTPGWNLVSVPLNPSPNSASSVFGQTPYVYNPTTNTYTRPSTIQPGIGYWINGGANLTANGTETPTTGNFSITLKKGWNMIGNPFRFKVKVSDMKVNYNSTEYTMTQAETNGIVVGTLYPYVNGVYQFVNASDGGAVEPWVGYWILSDKDCTLLVPPIPAQ